MAFAKIVLIGIVLLLTTIASANDMDDVLLKELNSSSGFKVSMRAVNSESEAAGQAMLAKKYHMGNQQKERNDGMLVALRPARR